GGRSAADRPTPPPPSRAARPLERLVDEMLERTRRLGFTQGDLLATLAARTPDGNASAAAPPTKVLLVECNWAELSRYGAELEARLPLRVDRILVEDLPVRVAGEPGLLSPYQMVVTTFFHVHEVKLAMPPGAPPVVALLSAANISTLLRLTELPEGTSVGLVCNTPKGSQNLLRSVQSAGLWHLNPVLASTDDPWSVGVMLEK